MLPATARRLAPALLALLTLTAASAQTQRGMTPWDVARLRVVSTAVVSPDAEYVAYTVAAPADPLAENEPVRSELHLFHVDRGTDRVLVGPEVNPQNVQWTPEGDLSYLTKGDSDRVAAIYSYEIETGVVRRVLAFENAIEDYAWHSDGRRIAFIANAPRPAPTVRLPYRPEVVDEDFVHRGVWIAEAYRNESLTRLDVGGTAHAVAWHPG
ncbi:MAG TPA: hypothetical protein VD962_04660, partial [Rubricoccaceae bacterium]|nr:hypothetical protein [Rubricoccaceae bacterium]